MRKISGIYTALITPFLGEELDEEGLRQLLRRQVDAQVDGVVVLGSTGEAPTLRTEEQERIVRIAIEECSGKIQVLVGTGSYSTAETIENTQAAERAGADGALIVTPYYNKPSQEGIFRHFEAIAAKTTLPITVYNVAGRCSRNIETPTLARMAQLPTIIGVKETSGDLNQMSDVVAAIRPTHPDFSMVSGDDSLTLPLMSIGGDGIISVASNLIPEQMVTFVRAAQAGRWDEARAQHYTLLPFFKSLFVDTNPMPIKEAMALCDLPGGSCRLPLCAISAANRAHIEKVLSSLHLLQAVS